MFELPDYVLYVLKKLSSRGFEAYIVGGCVRDIMLQKIPSDFDITTNALPFEIKKCFEEHKIIDIGEKHGTVTIIIDSRKIEITTYRIDGTYSNNRHPDKDTFSCNLYDDLKRRDFTINAMAMKSSGELTDNFNGRSDLKNKIIRTVGNPAKRFTEDALRILRDNFNGRSDLKNKIIRTVGNPAKRFTEDALRILRALRFASQLGFHIENKTSEMLHQYAYLIKNISAERIREEFVKILLGNSAEKILREYCDVIEVFIPEIKKSYGFKQYSPYHKYDVWEHTIHAVGASVPEKNVRTAMFFHDIAKPDCFKLDKNGRGHFKGHAVKSAEMTYDILKRLRFSLKDIKDIICVIYHHSDELDNKPEIKLLMNKIGIKNFINLLNVQRADSMSKQEFCRERLKKSNWQEKTAKEIIQNKECYTLKGLAVNGNDLMKLGYKGKENGKMLEYLLKEVIYENLENNKISIINYIKSLK